MSTRFSLCKRSYIDRIEASQTSSPAQIKKWMCGSGKVLDSPHTFTGKVSESDQIPSQSNSRFGLLSVLVGKIRLHYRVEKTRLVLEVGYDKKRSILHSWPGAGLI